MLYGPGVVRRVDVNALDAAFVTGKERLQRFEIVAVNDHIFGTDVLGARPGGVERVFTFDTERLNGG